MRAVQLGRFGGPEVLETVESRRPDPGPREVLVRVKASGINFAETLMRENRYALTPSLPAVLGSEIAGRVEGLGSNVTGLARGARVAVPMFAAGIFFGGYAEYVSIDADYAVPLPDAVSFEHAVALMVQGLTALHLIRQAPPKGKTVLVTAAAGGVGSLLVQLAKRAGAKMVIGAASTPEKRDLVRALGADIGIDYTQPGWTEELLVATAGERPGIIYESTGATVTKACLDILAAQGELVVYGALNIQDFRLGVPELIGLIFKNQALRGFALVPLLTKENLRTGLAELFDLARLGALRVTLGGTYPLERASDAHRALEGRSTIGKLVLIP